MINKENALKELNELLVEIKDILNSSIYFDMDYGTNLIKEEVYDAFILKVKTLFKLILKDSENDNIKKVSTLSYNSIENINMLEKIIQNLKLYIERGYILLEERDNTNLANVFDLIFNNFHKVVKSLRNRYENRNTIDVDDEYDVQDLLFSILQIFFKDIRKEEWTPSYAGNSSRVDFLLKEEKTVIEVKKTRKTMKDKDLGEQLIIDIAKYKSHPDCKKLICFVYDPEGRIVNPAGIVKDLEKENQNFVKIYINP